MRRALWPLYILKPSAIESLGEVFMLSYVILDLVRRCNNDCKLITKVNVVQVIEMMVLDFIKNITKLKELRPAAEGDASDELAEFSVVWRFLADIPPKYHFAAGLLMT